MSIKKIRTWRQYMNRYIPRSLHSVHFLTLSLALRRGGFNRQAVYCALMPNVLPDPTLGHWTKSSNGIGRHSQSFGFTDPVSGAEYPFAISDKRFLSPSVQAPQGPYHNGCSFSCYRMALVANLLALPRTLASTRLLTRLCIHLRNVMMEFVVNMCTGPRQRLSAGGSPDAKWYSNLHIRDISSHPG